MTKVNTHDECDKCGQAIRVVFNDFADDEADRELAYDVDTGGLHLCWTELPESAPLIRLD